MRARDAVLTEHAHRSPLRHGFFALLTAGAWSAFVWLVFPAITALLWLVGISVAYESAIAGIQAVQPVLLLGILLSAVCAGTVLVAWAETQRHRFSGVERRRRAQDVDVAEVGAALGATPEVAAVLQAGRVVIVHMRDDGTPLGAAAVSPPVQPRRGWWPVLPRQRSEAPSDAPRQDTTPSPPSVTKA
jgi:poly-beta-1,6-N-acetyl-D-glucosamine biosynthesis protein PgaD